MQIINSHDYHIITSCKEDDNMASLIKYLAEYLIIKEEDVDDSILYHHLINASFDIYDMEEIKNIMDNAIPKLFYYIPLQQKRGLALSDLTKFLYYQLYNLDVLKHEDVMINGEHSILIKDLYAVFDDNKLIPFSQYQEYLKVKGNISKVKKFN